MVRRVALLSALGLLVSGGALAVDLPARGTYSYYYGLTSQNLHVTVILVHGPKLFDMHYNVNMTCTNGGPSGVTTYDWPFSKHPIPIKNHTFSGTAKTYSNTVTTFQGKLSVNGKHVTGWFKVTSKNGKVKCSSGSVSYKTTRGPLKNW